MNTYSYNLLELAPFLIYFLGVLSPGPANLAIVQVALEKGKEEAIRLSLGVVTGSIFWGIFTFTGLIQIMQRFPFIVILLSLCGAVYMLWLAYINLSKFMSYKESRLTDNSSKSQTNYFIRGLMIHLTNPKAFLVWATILISSIGVDGNPRLPFYFVLILCAVIGIVVFSGYALLFSYRKIYAVYEKYSRYTHLVISLLFVIISIQLLRSIASIITN